VRSHDGASVVRLLVRAGAASVNSLNRYIHKKDISGWLRLVNISNEWGYAILHADARAVALAGHRAGGGAFACIERLCRPGLSAPARARTRRWATGLVSLRRRLTSPGDVEDDDDTGTVVY
jgi:hypothetical protein